MIENERIRLYPAGQEQMERFISAEKDEELKKAYCEMLEGCFKGIKENENPEIGSR